MATQTNFMHEIGQHRLRLLRAQTTLQRIINAMRTSGSANLPTLIEQLKNEPEDGSILYYTFFIGCVSCSYLDCLKNVIAGQIPVEMAIELFSAAERQLAVALSRFFAQ